MNLDLSEEQQILLNLILNARDAMPDGGTVRITAARATKAQLSDQEHTPGSPPAFACLTVSDTGTGMPPEVQSRVFEPFFTTKPRGQGTGLGLAMVHGLVEQHGGRITVQSDLGTGSTFRVLFPLLQSPP